MPDLQADVPKRCCADLGCVMPLQEVENADDLRLSQRLFKKCMGDKKKFCADIKFGASHLLSFL